jgi:predicted permease
MLRRVASDIRWSVRILSRYWPFTVAAALPLVLGVGVNTAIFTVFDASVLRPLSAPDAGRLVRVYEDSRDAARRTMFSYREYVDDRDGSTVFSDLAAYADTDLVLRVPDDRGDQPTSAALSGAFVSANYFRLFGGTLVTGRWFAADSDKDDLHSVVISRDVWTRRFASARDVVGRIVELNGARVSIVGVASPDFFGAEPASPDVFLPLGAAAFIDAKATWLTDDAAPGLRLIGRLRPNATINEADSVLSVLAQRRAALGGSTAAVRIIVARASYLAMEPEVLAGAALILFATGLVLLTACGNVATLLLARASARSREITVRLAVGASRGDLVRMLLTESAILVALSSAAALVLSTWTLRILLARAVATQALPDLIGLNLSPDLRILAYTSVVAIGTTVVCGLTPALRASRRDLVSALNDDGSATGQAGGVRSMNALVAAQIAVSFVLLASCGLLIKSEWRARRADIGIETAHTANLYIDFAANGYNEARAGSAVRSLRDDIRSLPGVTGVTIASRPPLSNSFVAQVSTNATARPVLAAYNLVDADFLPTLGIRIVRGHNVSSQAGGPPEVVISESLARVLWPAADAVGRRLDLRLLTSPTTRGPHITGVIVGGVARDTARAKLSLDANARYLYLPLTSGWTPLQTAVVVRTAGPADAAVSLLHTATRAFNLTTSVPAQRLTDVLEERRRPVAIGALLAALLGILALSIALVGEYALVSYSVGRRTREIGIRMALGAQTRSVVQLVLRQGAIAIGAGLAAGYVASMMAGMALTKFLFEVSPFDIVTYAIVGALFLCAGLLATAVPAYNAATLDPTVALRQRT